MASPHIRFSHGLNLPSLVGFDRSTICPIVTSVTASINRAAIIRMPTVAYHWRDTGRTCNRRGYSYGSNT